MYIRSLRLVNFQKHAELQIDFCNGVNILYGTSDAGKSCIRRALEWIVQNESFDGVRKTGTKKTIVTLTLDSGKEIERIRSQSINRYIIREGKNEKVFDSIGKSIPEEVKDLLTIYPIEVDGEEIYLNSQPQIALPFLFDKSPTFRMKLFNKLTGNDVLDQLFGQFNKDILRIKRGIKEETERTEKRTEELKGKKKAFEKAEAIHARLSIRIKNLKNTYEKYAKLLELKELNERNNEHFKETKLKLKNLKVPEDVDIKQLSINIDRYDKLKTLKTSSEKGNTLLEKVRGQLSDLKPVSMDLSTLKGKIERFDNIRAIYEKFSQNRGLFTQIKQNRKDAEKDLVKLIKEYKALLREAKVCPICQNAVTDECLKEIRL